MPKKREEENSENIVREELGVSPAQLAGATFIGMPEVLAPATRDVPSLLTELLASGKKIPEDKAGLPISAISEFTREEAKAIKRFAKEQGVDVPIVRSLLPGNNSYYAPPQGPGPIQRKLTDLGKRVGLLDEVDDAADEIPEHIGLGRTSVPVAFHEIGHATKSKAQRALRALRPLSDGVTGSIARGAIASNVLAPPDEDSSVARKVLYEGAPAIAAATHLPQIAEESRASYHALRGARRHGVGILKALKDLAPALGTYLGPAAGTAFATEAAKRLVQALNEGAEAKQQVKTGADDLADPSKLRASGMLTEQASSAWRVGGTPPKPKSSSPKTSKHPDVKSMDKGNPPSNHKFHKDLLSSLYNPQRGFRTAVG